MALRSASFALLFGSLAVTRAGAAQEPLELRWTAPAECPQEATVRERFNALVPREMLERARLRADGTITKMDERYRLVLRLEVDDLAGERSIESDSCTDLAGAAAVALGLLLQSAAPEPTAPSAAEDEKPAPTAPTPAPEPSSNPTKDDASRARTLHVFVTPELAVEVGPLPKPNVSFALGAGVSYGRWLAALDAQLPAKQHITLVGALEAGADTQHSLLSLSLCHAWQAPPFELLPCAVFAVERLSATGSGPVVTARSERDIWPSFGLGGMARLRLTEWLAVGATFGGRVEAVRPSIRIEGLEPGRRLGPAAFSLRAGPILVF